MSHVSLGENQLAIARSPPDQRLAEPSDQPVFQQLVESVVEESTAQYDRQRTDHFLDTKNEEFGEA